MIDVKPNIGGKGILSNNMLQTPIQIDENDNLLVQFKKIPKN